MANDLHKEKPVGNINLHKSRDGKTDEFYTRISLIENELRHYWDFFRGKIVFCNCDDPYESNFFKYFAMNFNFLGLKKLIVTCFAGSPITNTQLSLFDYENTEDKTTKSSHKIEIEEITDENADGGGDFRSVECLKLLKEADVVVTNPPFSLFREYIAQLMEYGKHFLIIGNKNAITYREILPLFINNKIWLGYNSGHYWFRVPDDYEVKKTDFKIDEAGVKWRRMGNICWFTNIDIKKRHDNMTLFRNYSPEKYPKYDGYDAIEVSRTADIPCDYYGVMGVPITFIDKHNPEQFELLGDTRFHDGQDFSDDINIINGKTLYRRLLIRRRKTLHD
jgi:hypothetical protein